MDNNVRIARYSIFFAAIASAAANSANNLPTAGPMPDVVFLRISCEDMANCATTLDEVMNWTWETRQPSSEFPLLIDAGPGAFPVHNNLYCEGNVQPRGHVTLRGSGRDNTTFFSPISRSLGAVLVINQCNNLTFQDLTIKGSAGQADWGVEWSNAGSSNWSNVSISAPSFAWYDSAGGGGCSKEDAGRHNWYASSLTVVGTTGFTNGTIGTPTYYSACGDAWIYGTEITNNNAGSGRRFGVKTISQGAQVHLYGSSVRVSSTTAGFQPLFGLYAEGGGIIHFHGGEVAVRAEGTGNQSVTGAYSHGEGSMVHAYEISWGLQASGSGTATRIGNNGGMVRTIFNWGPSVEPPALSSLNGADIFIETDCDITGNCSTAELANQRPHLMAYAVNCSGPGGPWFNMATNKCRGE